MAPREMEYSSSVAGRLVVPVWDAFMRQSFGADSCCEGRLRPLRSGKLIPFSGLADPAGRKSARYILGIEELCLL